jgi:ATP-dependent Clp protease adapter protein ClpS
MGRAIQVMVYAAGRVLHEVHFTELHFAEVSFAIFNQEETTTPTALPETETVEEVEEIVGEEVAQTPPGEGGSGYRVILYDDDYHGMDEVAAQIHKATQYPPMKCWEIMLEAHRKGRTICYKGSREKCHRVTRVLREIRLQCEVDCD